MSGNAGTGAGMRSLVVAFPNEVRGNAYWKARHPETVARAERSALARLWAGSGGDGPRSVFEEEMAPYLSDPFRGGLERRVLAEGEGSLALELRAARDALAAAQIDADSLDLVIDVSFRPDTPGVGNAVYLARELGVDVPAWNLETACSGSVVAFHTACDLVRSGAYRNVLVVVSCTYSRDVDVTDTLAWFLGDGAGAFVVGRLPAGQGCLGHRTINSRETCGTFAYQPRVDDDGRVVTRMGASPDTGRRLHETAQPYLLTCCRGAADRAGVAIDEIDFFVFNTPTAWYASFCARALGVARDKTLSTFGRYANIGPALMPANLYHAAASERIHAGDLVLLYSVGSSSSVSAAVVRWGEVRLGPSPSARPHSPPVE